MIAVRDFVPADRTPMLAITRRRESIADMLERVNAFIREHDLIVVNIETLLLPANADATIFNDQDQLDLGMLEIGVQRQQVIRLWYRKKD